MLSSRSLPAASPALSALALLALATFSSGCAGAGALPRATAVSEVGESYAGSTQIVAPGCLVDSPNASIELVAVLPAGAEPFALALKKVPLLARPSTVADAPVAVEVRGVIEFRGLAMIDAYALKTPRMLAGGMLRAGPGARLVRAAARGATLSGSMELGGGGVIVEAMSVACSALEVPAESASSLPAEDDADWAVDGGDEPVTFWSGPGRGNKISVWPGTSFHRVETRGDFTLVAVTMDEGSALHGWVETSKVTEGGFGSLGLGGYGCGGGFYSSHSTVGKATVQAGTKVAATPGGAAWGVIPRAATMMVRYSRGNDRTEDLAEIVELDGYSDQIECPGLSHAWIPASAVTFVKN